MTQREKYPVVGRLVTSSGENAVCRIQIPALNLKINQ